MKTVKKLLSFAFYGIILFFMYYIALQIIVPEKTIDYIGFKTFVILSPSMEPKINVNDIVVVKKVKQQNIEVRDIITFKVYISALGEEAYVTNYVGEIDRSGQDTIYYTQRLNAGEGEFDEWKDKDGQDIYITYDDIAGEYVFKIPNLGFVSRMLQNPFMLGFIVVDVFIIYTLFQVIKKNKK